MSRTHVPASLRRLVQERSGNRCEYCLMPLAVSLVTSCIDHVIAEKHGGLTDAANLAQSCIACNQFKGSDLASIDAQTGTLVALFHPRREKWNDHFAIVSARIVGLTPVGRVTVELLRLNDPERVEERLELLSAGLLPLDGP